MTFRNHRRVAALLLATGSLCQTASATTHFWIGGEGSWGDATQWNGSPNPPNTISADTSVGNNGTVSIAGGTFLAGLLRIGHSGATGAGTGKLIIDSGSLTMRQNITIGDGNAGTLIINGGNFITEPSKNMWMGGGTLGSASGYLEISAGTLSLRNKAGITKWTTNPGSATINMSGGTIVFPTTDNGNTILVDKFTFTGGTITNLAIATIHELTGNGAITMTGNSPAGLTIDQAIDTEFTGTITNVGGAGSSGKFTKSGAGNLTLGSSTVVHGRAATTFNGGTVKVNNNQTFATGSFIFNGGTLDLNGFAQAGSFLTGNGTVKLGNGGSFSGGPGTGTTNTFDGLITGTGTFTKVGSGTLIFSASQGYVGNTVVNAGTLDLRNASSNSLANSPVITVSSFLFVNGLNGGAGITLNSANSQNLSATGRVFGNVNAPVGTTVRGSGTFNDSLSVSGTISNSGGVNTMTVGSLSLNAASVNVDVGATGLDKVVVTSADALTLNGTSTISLNDLGGVVPGTYTLFDYNGATPLTDLGHLALASPTLGSLNVALLYNSLDPTSIDLSITSNITNSTWNFNGDGNASDGTKWNGGVPNGADHIANFTSLGGAITASPIVTLDTDVTLGTINFDHSAGSYTIAATEANKLILDVTTGGANVNVISGHHSITAPVVLSKNVTINATGSISFIGAVTGTGKSITKAGPGMAQFENVRAGTIAVSGGTLRISSKGSPNAAAGTSVVNGFSVSSGSIDLTNNAMVVNYSTLGTLMTDVRSALQAGQLATSMAAGGHALGYADNATLGRLTFAGQDVGSTSFLIGYTFAGDANLDGKVNALDFNAVAASFGVNDGSQIWVNGDFDYSGNVNSADFTALSQNFNSALSLGGPAATGALGALVPEPSALLIVAIGASLCARRRRA